MTLLILSINVCLLMGLLVFSSNTNYKEALFFVYCQGFMKYFLTTRELSVRRVCPITNSYLKIYAHMHQNVRWGISVLPRFRFWRWQSIGFLVKYWTVGWLSGRKRQSWKLLSVKAPRVRIPPPPPWVLGLWIYEPIGLCPLLVD